MAPLGTSPSTHRRGKDEGRAEEMEEAIQSEEEREEEIKGWLGKERVVVGGGADCHSDSLLHCGCV